MSTRLFTVAEQGLLPQALLTASLRTPLRSRVSDSWGQLQQQRPSSYQDCLSYALSPLPLTTRVSPPSSSSAAQATQKTTRQPLRDAQLYWQQLHLNDGSLCSELMVMCYQHSLYISCLNLLPASYGLYAPLQPNHAMRYIDQLLQRTLSAVSEAALISGCEWLVSTLINPNLAVLFKRHGFRLAAGGGDVVGLRLPARFCRHLI